MLLDIAEKKKIRRTRPRTFLRMVGEFDRRVSNGTKRIEKAKNVLITDIIFTKILLNRPPPPLYRFKVIPAQTNFETEDLI